MTNKILFIIDMQNSFINPKGNLYIKNSKKLIIKANNYLYKYGNNFNKIILTYDTHFKETYSKQSESELFPFHCEYNSKDWDLALDKKILNNLTSKIYYLKKDNFNLWENFSYINHLQNDLYKIINYRTNKIEFATIIDFLKENPPCNTHISLFGVASDYCCKYAFDGLLKLNYKIDIIKNLTKEINTNIIKILANNEYICYTKIDMLNLV